MSVVAHRIKVEADKPDRERGYYIHPDLYGQPAEKKKPLDVDVVAYIHYSCRFWPVGVIVLHGSVLALSSLAIFSRSKILDNL